MITISITKTTTETWTEQQNVVTKETPTDKVKQKEYGAGTEVVMAREYGVREVTKSSDKDTLLLKQVIPDDSLDLAAVIRAINKLD